MKYLLAIVNRLFDQFGSDIGLGYDIMCAFIKTLQRSSLGHKMVAFHLQGVVPAFYGHAHNRLCQVWWHPTYMDDVGIEDFEVCEHTFDGSNELAPGTRLATPFHQTQQIDEHFYLNDQDKHALSGNVLTLVSCLITKSVLGNFIYQNYQQALETIRFSGEKLAVLSAKLGTTAADYEGYLVSKWKHLQSLTTEPPEVCRTADYMEHLIKLDRLQ
jgi:hypothetical protein